MSLVYLRKWGTTGNGDGQLDYPNGIAVASDEVYVADRMNNRVQVFTRAGVYVRKWGTSGSGNGQFSGPTGVTVYDDEVYVVDCGNYRVQVFTPAGVYVRQWGSNGGGDGQFKSPQAVAVMDDEVYVSEWWPGELTWRVQVFTPAGVYVRKWGAVDANGPTPAYLAAVGSEIYLADEDGFRRVRVYSTTGTLLRTIGPTLSAGLAVADGRLYVADFVNKRIAVYSAADGTLIETFGSSGTGDGQFVSPFPVAYDTGEVFVGDNTLDRIQVFGSPVVGLGLALVFDRCFGITHYVTVKASDGVYHQRSLTPGGTLSAEVKVCDGVAASISLRKNNVLEVVAEQADRSLVAKTSLD